MSKENGNTNTPRYSCKIEHLREVLFYIDSAIKELKKSNKDTTPEQLTLKGIYDQLSKIDQCPDCGSSDDVFIIENEEIWI